MLSVTSPKGKFKTGDPYKVTSAVSVAGPEHLRYAGTDYPAWVSARYLQLPASLPQRVRDLAREVTIGATTPYDRAKAVEQYLRNSYPYNLRVDPPPYNADGVDHFLFTLGEGYSEYFGSTMTVMMRSVGVPARLAVGYTTGDQLEGQSVFAVTDSHSHAWLEIYFPGYGWIPFEPTPGKTLPGARQAEPEQFRTSPIGLANLESDDDICFDEFSDLDECSDSGESQSDIDLNADAGGGRSLIGLWLWFLAALAGLIVVGGTGRWLWRRFLATPDNPRVAFRRMTTLASLASAGPEEFQTPYQFGNQLRQVLPAQETPVSIIVAAYVRSRYGNKYSTASERRLLAVAWRRLRLPMLWAVIRRRVR